MANISTTYILKTHYYGFRFGGDRIIRSYDSFEEALEAKENYWFDPVYIEKNYILKEKNIILSEEEVALHYKRAAAKKAVFDYHKDSLCFGFLPSLGW